MSGARGVVAIDLRGCGGSSRDLPAGACQPAKAVEDIRCVIEEIDAGPVHLLGFSYGGQLIQRFVARYPDLVASMVLASTTAYAITEELHGASTEYQHRRALCPQHALPEAGSTSQLAQVVRGWALERAPLDVWDRRMWPSYRRLLQRVEFSGEWLAEMLRSGLESPRPEDPVAAINSAGVPVLILHGRYDFTFPVRTAQRLHDQLATSELASSRTLDTWPTSNAQPPGAQP